MKKESRRVKMTKAVLTDSFLQKLEEKPLPRITVKEICELADINRSTYYVYYCDPYDQMDQLIKTFIQEQAVYIDEILEQNISSDEDFSQVLCKLMNYYKDHGKMLKILWGTHGNTHLEYDVLAFFAERVLQLQKNNEHTTKRMLQNYTYAASGCFGLILYWIQTGCQDSPQEIADRITELTKNVR